MMLGHLMEWFYSGLAGIQQAPDSKGYEHIVIRPGVVGDITWVDASYGSIKGVIGSCWKRENGGFNLEVRIPANCTATIVFPQPDPEKILEGDIALKSSVSVKNIHSEEGNTYFDIASGRYNFRSETDK